MLINLQHEMANILHIKYNEYVFIRMRKDKYKMTIYISLRS